MIENKNADRPPETQSIGASPVNHLFSKKEKIREGKIHINPETVKQIRQQCVKNYKDPTKMSEQTKAINLEIVETISVNQDTFNLHLFIVGRAKKDPRIIFILTETEGWKFAGFENDPKLRNILVSNSFIVNMPSVFAETVMLTQNPILKAMNLSSRTQAYVDAFKNSVIDVFKKLEKHVKEEKTEHNKTEKTDR